jgi:hypothetical protein
MKERSIEPLLGNSRYWTPRPLKWNGKADSRYKWDMADVTFSPDYKFTRGLGLKGTVLVNGTIYKIKGAACDLPGCQCDIVAIPL